MSTGKAKVVPVFSLNAFTAPREDRYKTLSLQESLDMAKEKMIATAEDFVALGYYLKHIRDEELYKERGYKNIWECAGSELCLTQSTASRYISVCEKFSRDGDSPFLDMRYKGFGKSQLLEMLTITDRGLMEQVTPDMPVRRIQELKKSMRAEGPGIQPEVPARHEAEGIFPSQADVVVDGTFREIGPVQGTQDAAGEGPVLRGGYDLAIIDEMIRRYEGYLDGIGKDDGERQISRYRCLLDGLELLRARQAGTKDDHLIQGQKEHVTCRGEGRDEI